MWLRHARRQVIAVVPRQEQRPVLPEGTAHPGREYADETCSHLATANIPYSRRDLDLDFGQPLTDEADAVAFARAYHHGQDQSDGEMLEKLRPSLLRRSDNTLFLPRRRRLSVIVFPAAQADGLSRTADVNKNGASSPA